MGKAPDILPPATRSVIWSVELACGSIHNETMALEEYHAKRAFDATPEPTGTHHDTANEPLRFVVQKHDASQLHYDFRLEMEGVLKSWAVPKVPSLNPADKHLAMMTEDHPFEYRTFEGTIPEGNYGAGTVMVWDEGAYEPLHANGYREHDEQLARAGWHAGHLTFILNGTKLKGEFALIKMQHAEDNAWLLIKAHKDKYAGNIDVTKQDRSAITGRTLEEIAAHAPITQLHANLEDTPARALPDQPRPMLAELAEGPFDDPDWRFEVKWDGYRVMARTTPKGVQLFSRNGQDYSQTFAPVTTELEHLRLPAVIDGEMVIVDDAGKSNFQMLQNYLRTGAGRLVYYAFDLPYLNGHDLSSLPLDQRRELLRRVLPQGHHLRLSEDLAGVGRALFKQAQAGGLEGLMAKRASSTYQAGRRSQDWLKVKASHRQEAVIIGYTEPRGGANTSARAPALLRKPLGVRRLHRHRLRRGHPARPPRTPSAAAPRHLPRPPCTPNQRAGHVGRTQAGGRDFVHRMDRRRLYAASRLHGATQRQRPSRGRARAAKHHR